MSSFLCRLWAQSSSRQDSYSYSYIFFVLVSTFNFKLFSGSIFQAVSGYFFSFTHSRMPRTLILAHFRTTSSHLWLIKRTVLEQCKSLAPLAPLPSLSGTGEGPRLLFCAHSPIPAHGHFSLYSFIHRLINVVRTSSFSLFWTLCLCCSLIYSFWSIDGVGYVAG